MTTSISIALEPDASAQAFLKCLYVLIMDVHDNDVSTYKPLFKQWFIEATTFLARVGQRRQITRLANKFMMGPRGSFNQADAKEVGDLLRASLAEQKTENTLSDLQVKMLRDCSALLRTMTDQERWAKTGGVWERLVKNVPALKEAKLTAAWVRKQDAEISVEHVGNALATVKRITLEFTGKTMNADHWFMDLSQEQHYRKEDPEKMSEYSEAKKSLILTSKKALSAYVRSSGSDLVNIDAAREYLDGKNIPNDLPIGFVGGQIDAHGFCYTREGRKLQRIPTGRVEMNPNYKPETDKTYVLKPKFSMGGRPPEIRTVAFLAGNKSTRHANSNHFTENEAKFRKKWIADMKQQGTKNQMAALMVELIYRTASRIGGEGNASGGQPTYGLSTLHVQHVKLMPKAITIKFPGKKDFNSKGELVGSQVFTYKVTMDPNTVIAYNLVKDLLAGKGPNDLVFSYGGKPIIGQYINRYMKSKGIKISIHRFRNVKGTKMVMADFAKCPWNAQTNPGQKLVDAWVDSVLMKVGIALHHKSGEKATGAVALKSYVDPHVVADFYESLKLRVPTAVVNAIKQDK